jgi:S-adenosylmethionine hydrolase
MTERPVIGFLTDFGLDGAAATCRGVMLSIARDAHIVDICHTVAKYAVADGAYLLAASLPWLPVGVHVAVIDPGVGSERRPIAILTTRGDVLVGPDNGLLVPAAERLGGVAAARRIANPAWQLPVTSATFHGRDIFSPVAAHLALAEPFAEVGPEIDPATLVRLEPARAVVDGEVLVTRVTYVDSFGNVRLAGGSVDLAAAVGALVPGAELALELDDGRRERLTWQRTFGDVATGALLLYADSAGNLAIAVANGNAAIRLGLATGDRVRVRGS